MRDDERKKWGETRSRGLTRFLLVTGLGRAGAAFLVVFGTADYLSRYGYANASVSHVVSRLALWLPGSAVVGVTFALFFWLVMNQQYSKGE